MTVQEYQELKRMMQLGKIEKVLSKLKELCKNDDCLHYSEIELLSIQYQEEKRRELLGFTTGRQEINRIIYAVIIYVDVLNGDKSALTKLKSSVPIGNQKLKSDAKAGQYFIILLLFASFIAKFFEGNQTSDFDIAKITQSLKLINLNGVTTDSDFPIFSESNDIICDKLKCGKEDGKLFINELEFYLSNFWVYFESSIAINNGSSDFENIFCTKYLDRESIVQAMDSNLEILTLHKEDFCYSKGNALSLLEFNYNSLRYEIESIYSTDDGTTSENKFRTIRFVIRSSSSATNCLEIGNCQDFIIDHALIVEFYRTVTQGYKFRMEGVLINKVVLE